MISIGQEYMSLNAFKWRQLFALDSVVVKTQTCLAQDRLPLNAGQKYCNTFDLH